MKKTIIVLALGAAGSAFAQTAPTVSADSAFGRFMTNVVGSGQQTVSFASGGQATLSTASGNLAFEAPGSTSIGGKPLAVVVKGSPKLAALGKGLLATAKVFGPVGVGLAVFDLFSEFTDFTVTHNPASQTLDIKKRVGGIVCASDCKEYQQPNTTIWHLTLEAACQAGAATAAKPNSQFTQTFYGVVLPATCQYRYTWGSMTPYVGNVAVQTRVIPPYNTGQMVDSTEQELIDAIATKSGWPTTSNLSKAAKSAIDQGYAPEIDETTKTITGPATSEPTVTTKTLPDGTVETTTQKSNLSYSGNNVTVVTTSTVTNYNPVTNQTTNISETTTENPVEPAKDVCEKNPDTLGCAKFGTPENPTLSRTTSPFVLQDKLFGGGEGACPAPLAFNVRGASYAIGFQPICDQLVYLKALMLMLAGVMAAYILADSFKVG